MSMCTSLMRVMRVRTCVRIGRRALCASATLSCVANSNVVNSETMITPCVVLLVFRFRVDSHFLLVYELLDDFFIHNVKLYSELHRSNQESTSMVETSWCPSGNFNVYHAPADVKCSDDLIASSQLSSSRIPTSLPHKYGAQDLP